MPVDIREIDSPFLRLERGADHLTVSCLHMWADVWVCLGVLRVASSCLRLAVFATKPVLPSWHKVYLDAFASRRRLFVGTGYTSGNHCVECSLLLFQEVDASV